MKFLTLIFSFLLIQFPGFTQEVYIMATELGEIEFEVYPNMAPLTVVNFRKYVSLGKFEGANFYRVVRMDNQSQPDVKIDVIQGNFTDDKNGLGSIEHEPSNQTGIKHKNGTISMARLAPGTASFAFFICINDQSELDYGGKRNPDGQGFAAFGKVIKGIEIVREIQGGKADKQKLLNTVDIIGIRKKD